MDPFYEQSMSEIRFLERIYSYIPHLHNEPEILYLFEGSLDMHIGDQSYSLNSGDLICIFPFMLHDYKITTENAEFLKAYILIPPVKTVENFSSTFRYKVPENPLIKNKDLHPDVLFALNRLKETIENDEGVFLQSAYLQVVFSRVISQLKIIDSVSNNSNILIQNVLRYINQNYTDSMTLESISEHFSVSRSHLSHLFSKKIHTSFNDFLNSLRINSAQGLLMESDRSIIDIAFECGYSSVRSFNRNFLEKTGLTPSEYRKKIKSEK